MPDPIIPIAEVRRRVLDLINSGIDHDEAVHRVAVSLHMSVERVQECLMAQEEQA